MSKRLLLVVLLPCAAALADAASAQTPLSAGHARRPGDTASQSKRTIGTYPQFAYPSAGVRPNATPAFAARRRSTSPPPAAASDPYAFGGWNNLSYDPPSLDQPWSAHAPASQLPPPGQ